MNRTKRFTPPETRPAKWADALSRGVIEKSNLYAMLRQEPHISSKELWEQADQTHALFDLAQRFADHARSMDTMHDESWAHARELLIEEAEHAGLIDPADAQ